MKTDSKKRSLRRGNFIARVYAVYFPGHYGTDADHVPIIPGNNFTPDCNHGEEPSLQHPAFGNMDMGQAQIGE